jgi:hypothetical protein
MGKLEGKRLTKNLDVDWRIILNIYLREMGWWYGLDSSSLGQRPVANSFEHGNEPSVSIKYWEILE